MVGRAAGGVTYAENDGVDQVDPLVVRLLGGVLVLELLHREDEVGDDEDEDAEVEGERIPNALKISLKQPKSVLAIVGLLPSDMQGFKFLTNSFKFYSFPLQVIMA